MLAAILGDEVLLRNASLFARSACVGKRNNEFVPLSGVIDARKLRKFTSACRPKYLRP